jgi:hypothetical protein
MHRRQWRVIVGVGMDASDFTSIIVSDIESINKQILTLQEQLHKLNVQLNCIHDIRVSHYSDYYSKITTYRCVKCGYSVNQ